MPGKIVKKIRKKGIFANTKKEVRFIATTRRREKKGEGPVDVRPGDQRYYALCDPGKGKEKKKKGEGA